MIARELLMVSRAAHVLQRTGLAMAGAMGGTFVAAQLARGHIAFFGTLAFIATTIVIGAVGFYLGIDTPPKLFHPKDGASTRKIDAAELLSAIGTFLATMVAFFSVGVVVLRSEPDIGWTAAIMAGWVLGVAMQIVAGTIARTRV